MLRGATGGGSKAPFLEEQNNSRDLGGKRKRGLRGMNGGWFVGKVVGRFYGDLGFTSPPFSKDNVGIMV